MLIEYVGIGVIVFFLLVGLIGTFVPLIPGTLLIWLTILVYAVLTKFAVIEPGLFTLITLIGLVTGTSNLWLSLLGAKAGGAGVRSLGWGVGGALAGFLVFNLLGAVLGYAAGILLAEYRERRDWRSAWKASLTGLAGWGLSTLVEAGGGLVMIILFLWKVLAQG